ncbi:omwaprin-c-like [Anolis sagrei]|uniref:omwaprin-c-like n=1 Tax=Anolis sagrei TaxID=38937 RepID=UPI003521B6AC
MKSSGGLIVLLALLAVSALIPAASGKEKPGKCPVPPPNTGSPFVVKCKSDHDCPGAKKCCNWNCMIDCFDPVFA